MFGRRAPSSSSRIVVRLPNWVGDTLMALPAVHALRVHNPEACVFAMARPEHLELAQRMLAFDGFVAAPAAGGPDRKHGWWRAVGELRALRLDSAVLLAPSFESALTAFLARIPIRIGHVTDRRGFLLTHRVPVVPAQHRSEGFLDVVSRLGATPASGPMPFRFGPEEDTYVTQLFRQAGLADEDRPIFLNPAAAKTPRTWSSRRFRELAEVLAERHEGVPIFVHHHSPFVAPDGWPDRPSIHLIEGATLVELGALIERCCLYVGNDSGPMHIAAAMGLPTVGVYGPSSPDLTSPRGSAHAPHLAVSAFFPCSPCRERFFEECPSPPTSDGRPPCLDAVSVQTVARQVDRLLVS